MSRAEMLAKLLENGQCANEMETVAASDALAALVRAGETTASVLSYESPRGRRCQSVSVWDEALSALASALGVTEDK